MKRYRESVIGKMGGLDLVAVSSDDDHIITWRKSISRYYQAFIDIPESLEGKVYDVLSVGLSAGNEPIVTLQLESSIEVYRLPLDYTEWINHLRGLSMMGTKSLPSKVLFGKRQDGTY